MLEIKDAVAVITGGGGGIGLAIAKRALQRMGGELRIESAVGKGSTFLISLPAAIVRDAHPEC